MSATRGRAIKLAKALVAVLGHWLLEEGVLLGAMILIFVGAGVLALLFGMLSVGYDLVFDPQSTDVAARLTSLSIDASKRI